jgi:hypothetical protein
MAVASHVILRMGNHEYLEHQQSDLEGRGNVMKRKEKKRKEKK